MANFTVTTQQKSINFKRVMGAIFTGAIVLSVPLTIITLRNPQDVRQYASSPNIYKLAANCAYEEGNSQSQKVSMFWQKTGEDKFYQFTVYDLITNLIVSDITVQADVQQVDMPQFAIDPQKEYLVHMWTREDQGTERKNTGIEIKFGCTSSKST